MAWSFLSLFINIPMLLLVLGIVAAAAVVYFTLGPVKLIQLALDARVWIVIGAITAGVVMWHSAHTIQDQKQEIANVETDKQAGHDSQAVVTDLVKKTRKRQVQAQNEQAAIDSAAPGDELDALMDEIAQEQTPTKDDAQ